MKHTVAGRLSAWSLEALGSRAWPAGRLVDSLRSRRTRLVSKPDDRLLVANKESHHQIPMVSGMVF